MLSLLAAVSADYCHRSRESADMQQVAALTGVAFPALSLPYIEAAQRCSHANFNETYPQMIPVKKRDFLYAR